VRQDLSKIQFFIGQLPIGPVREEKFATPGGKGHIFRKLKVGTG